MSILVCSQLTPAEAPPNRGVSWMTDPGGIKRAQKGSRSIPPVPRKNRMDLQGGEVRDDDDGGPLSLQAVDDEGLKALRHVLLRLTPRQPRLARVLPHVLQNLPAKLLPDLFEGQAVASTHIDGVEGAAGLHACILALPPEDARALHRPGEGGGEDVG
eukprot:CAMPEP_0114135202 /NCGR_PEP_ID=MMETSP0043_2-20121206/14577_1 /TAXON_ID=464988 /ORGANISM="Hemiselmis andersenii, Strain CCMP644" /LENGTH=157 /DNA_ID=CAMNT_0001228917 /DNA_START=76 /DNA_END=551 /DNA_ORIENTATION=-